MSYEWEGGGACTGMLTPHDRIIEVDGEPADTLQQVTSRFKGSAHEVKVKVASRVVFGGFMLKKGELNTEFQIRWFLLVDEDECAVLRYYDGRNAVTRKLKGEIKISPQEVRSVRSYLHEDVVTGAKTPGVVINQAGRTWELLTKTAAESRMGCAASRPAGRQLSPSPLNPLPPLPGSLPASPTCTVCNRCRAALAGAADGSRPSPRCRATTTCSARSPHLHRVDSADAASAVDEKSMRCHRRWNSVAEGRRPAAIAIAGPSARRPRRGRAAGRGGGGGGARRAAAVP